MLYKQAKFINTRTSLIDYKPGTDVLDALLSELEARGKCLRQKILPFKEGEKDSERYRSAHRAAIKAMGHPYFITYATPSGHMAFVGLAAHESGSGSSANFIQNLPETVRKSLTEKLITWLVLPEIGKVKTLVSQSNTKGGSLLVCYETTTRTAKDKREFINYHCIEIRHHYKPEHSFIGLEISSREFYERLEGNDEKEKERESDAELFGLHDGVTSLGTNRLKKSDARRKFMPFADLSSGEKLRNSKVYYYNLVMQETLKVAEACGISPKIRAFLPNIAYKIMLEPDDFPNGTISELLIVNAQQQSCLSETNDADEDGENAAQDAEQGDTAMSEAEMAEFEAIFLASGFKKIRFYKDGQAVEPGESEEVAFSVSENGALLVISNCEPTKLSKGRPDKKTTVWTMAREIENALVPSEGQYDFYTYFKYTHLACSSRPIVMQHLFFDRKKGVGELLDVKRKAIRINSQELKRQAAYHILSKRLEFIEANATKEDAERFIFTARDSKGAWREYSAAPSDKVRNIAKELMLKKAVVQGGAVLRHELFSEFDGFSFEAVYIHSKKREKYLKAASVSFRVENDTLLLESKKTYSHKDEIEFHFPFVKRGAKDDHLLDGQMYLFDKDSGIVLSAYTGLKYNPALIGRMDRSVGEDIEEIRTVEKPGRRYSNNETMSVPYVYGAPSQGIYLEEHETFAYYFVPNAVSVKASGVERSPRIYTCEVKSMDGGPILNYSDTTLYRFFVSTFTHSVVRFKENARSSLFEKLAKICVVN